MSEDKTLTRQYAERYRGACKKEKEEILDEFMALTNYQRCYAAWLLRQQRQRIRYLLNGSCKEKSKSKRRACERGITMLRFLMADWHEN